jgi:tRNA1(Val) A37 N6-methylase TrmN6
MEKETTIDNFFNGKLKIIQPTQGFRAGSDAVLLSAVANSCSGKVLDVGCGVATASLCFSYNNAKAKITSIDIQDGLLELAKKNIKENSFENIDIKKVDITSDKPDYQTYNSVITNPPFFKDGHGVKSPNAIKQTANTGEIDLKQWIDFCFLSLKDKGDFTIIFVADRLSELLFLMHERFGDVEIIPLYPRLGQDAKRVIVKAKKNTKGVTKLTSGIILHKEDGSSNIEEILREGARFSV